MKNNAISRRTLLKGALFTAGSVIAAPVIGQSSRTNSVIGSIPVSYTHLTLPTKA